MSHTLDKAIYPRYTHPVRRMDEDGLAGVIQKDCEALVGICLFLSSDEEHRKDFNRRLVGRLHMEAAKCEEFLDAYGTGQNVVWYPFRKAVGAVKQLSRVGYALLHIKNTSPFYHLSRLEEDKETRIDRAIETIADSVRVAAENLWNEASHRGLLPPKENIWTFVEIPVQGVLKATRAEKEDTFPDITAVHLATAFLNCSQEHDILRCYLETPQPDTALASLAAGIVTEEHLRELENQFHNLQSLYDTHLSGYSRRLMDHNLPILRGHISMIFHLLETATVLCHYHQRHASFFQNSPSFRNPIERDALLSILFDYCLSFAHIYVETSQDLCRKVLGRHTEIGTVDLPLPSYRGFHVRPSTLIAKIVTHYGSNVTMLLGDQVYNAAMPIELFRANEVINASKRRQVSTYLSTLPSVKSTNLLSTRSVMHKKQRARLLKELLREVMMNLLHQDKIVLYSCSGRDLQEFDCEVPEPQKHEMAIDYLERSVALQLAVGRIDIVSTDTVQFRGDKRTLQDLKILAENGYGEDALGNNITLPKALSYLQREI